MVSPALLDTDTLSNLLRQDGVVVTHARTYLAEHGQFSLSVITRYEVLRGLQARGAPTRIETFDNFCAQNTILSVTDAIATKAAEIYGTLHRRGELIADADILIAASALVNDLVLVTNNVGHFRRIDDLRIDNWIR